MFFTVVDDFEYLDSTITKDCSLDKEINAWINKESHSFNSLCKVLWCKRGIKVRPSQGYNKNCDATYTVVWK